MVWEAASDWSKPYFSSTTHGGKRKLRELGWIVPKPLTRGFVCAKTIHHHHHNNNHHYHHENSVSPTFCCCLCMVEPSNVEPGKKIHKQLFVWVCIHLFWWNILQNICDSKIESGEIVFNPGFQIGVELCSQNQQLRCSPCWWCLGKCVGGTRRNAREEAKPCLQV